MSLALALVRSDEEEANTFFRVVGVEDAVDDKSRSSSIIPYLFFVKLIMVHVGSQSMYIERKIMIIFLDFYVKFFEDLACAETQSHQKA